MLWSCSRCPLLVCLQDGPATGAHRPLLPVEMSAGSDTAGMEAAVLRKLDRHLLPLFCVLTVLNYIDRWLHGC